MSLYCVLSFNRVKVGFPNLFPFDSPGSTRAMNGY